MASVTCDTLKNFYADPSQSGGENGIEIYGDANLFFETQGGCTVQTPPEIVYNSYCGTPSGNSVYKNGCSEFLNTSGAKDKSSLIFNKIIDENYPNFNYTLIDQFASFCSHPISSNNSFKNIQSSYDGNIIVSLSAQGELYVAINGATELLPTGIKNVVQFCMANNTGLIYYVTSQNQTFSYVAITNKITMISQLSSQMPFLPTSLISASLPNLAMAALCSDDLNHVYRFNFSTGIWEPIDIIFSPIFSFNIQMAFDLVGSTLIFGVIPSMGQTARVHQISSFNTATTSTLLGFTPITWSFFGCAPLLLRNPNSGNLEMLSIWLNNDKLSFITINDLTEWTFNNVSQPIPDDNKLDPIPILGITWTTQKNQLVCFTKYYGLFYSPIIPTNPNSWILLSSSIQKTHHLTFGNVPLSISISNQIIFWSEFIPNPNPGFFTIRVITSSHDTLSYFLNTIKGSFYLLDNGEIRCYQNESLNAKLLWVSSTNDQSVPSNTLIANQSYVNLLFQENPLTISKNGLYGLSYDLKLGIAQLFQNVINGQEIVTWGGTSKLPTLRNSFQINYCQFLPTNEQTGTINETFPDPRCLCYYPRKLTAELFNVDLLSANPAQLKLIDGISPCLFGSCTQTRGTGTITGSLMSDVVQCPSTINLCSTIIQLGQESAINSGGGINIDNNCGGTAGKTPCSSTCPVGMGCAKDGFCSLLCDSNADCLALGGVCKNGVCELNTGESDNLPDWAIALIVLACFFVLIGIALGIYYSRKK